MRALALVVGEEAVALVAVAVVTAPTVTLESLVVVVVVAAVDQALVVDSAAPQLPRMVVDTVAPLRQPLMAAPHLMVVDIVEDLTATHPVVAAASLGGRWFYSAAPLLLFQPSDSGSKWQGRQG